MLVVMVCWVETIVPLAVGVILVLKSPGVTEAVRLALGETRASPVTAWESYGVRKKEPAIKDRAKTAAKARRSSSWPCPLFGLRERFELKLRRELGLGTEADSKRELQRGRKMERRLILLISCLILLAMPFAISHSLFPCCWWFLGRWRSLSEKTTPQGVLLPFTSWG